MFLVIFLGRKNNMNNLFENQTVVITGGSGFIGRSLVNSLLEDNAQVVCIASKSWIQNNPPILKEMIIADLREMSLHTILKHNEIDNPDYIIHLAGVTGGIHYLKQHEARTLQTNLSIISNSFKDIEKYPNLKGTLFVSSVCAYPQEYQTTTDPFTIVLSESLQTNHNPDSSYGWSKIMGEMLVQHYAKEFNVPGVSIRLFNTYGPYEHLDKDRTHFIPATVVKILNYPNSPVEVLGDGSQVRSFLYIDDVVEGFKKAILKVKDGSIINLGSDKPFTVKEIVERIIKISGKSIVPIYKPTEGVGAKGRIPNITKAKQLLDWAPRIELEEGLLKTYNWIKEVLI